MKTLKEIAQRYADRQQELPDNAALIRNAFQDGWRAGVRDLERTIASKRKWRLWRLTSAPGHRRNRRKKQKVK